MFNNVDKSKLKIFIVLGSIGGIASIIHLITIQRLRKMRKKLKKEGFKTVEETIMETLDKKNIDKNFQTVTKTFKKKCLFIEGRLFTNHPIYRIDNNEDTNILSYSKTIEKNFGNYQGYEEIVSYRKSNFIILKDFENENYKINLWKNSNESLEKIQKVTEVKIKPYSEKFFFFFGFLNTLFEILTLNLGSSLLNLHFLAKEKLYTITLNTPIFMYSTLYWNTKTNKLFLEPNQYISRSINSIKKDLDKSIIKSTITFIFFYLITVYSLNVIKKIIFKYLDKKREKDNMLKERLKIEKISGESLRDEQRCIICMDFVRNLILMPCKHLCICHVCFMEMKDYQMKKCPICKAIIKDHLLISYGD